MMKVPKQDEEEQEHEGGHKLPPKPHGGGAAGRAYQFELEHGLTEAEPSDKDSAADETNERLNKKIGRAD